MSRDKPIRSVPPEKLELYDRLIAMRPDIERKGATVPYTSVNGHMFSFLSASGSLALRLPSPERESFIELYKTSLVEAYGVLLKEYVQVPDELLQNTGELKKHLDASYAYVSSLKPKASKASAKTRAAAAAKGGKVPGSAKSARATKVGKPPRKKGSSAK
jgi:hypothetical protein